MRTYQNLSGNSGVLAYECADDGIAVQFADGMIYVYSYASAGRRKVERMKALAAAGRGLSTFIARHARDNWFSKFPSFQ